MAKTIEVVTPPVSALEEQSPAPEDPPGPKTLISLEQLQELTAAGSSTERVELLQSALGVQHYPVNPRTSLWVDFCFGVLNFARDDAHLPADKTLCLLKLAHDVYVYSTQPQAAPEPESLPTEPVVSSVESESVLPEGNGCAQDNVMVKSIPTTMNPAFADAYPTVEAVYDVFRDKIRHASGVLTNTTRDQSLDDPAPITAPFSLTEVTQIVAFFTSTFFRHLRAYQFVNRVPRPSVVRMVPLPTETPLRPPSLADAVSTE